MQLPNLLVSPSFVSFTWILCSIISSVGLIFLNKVLMNSQFSFVYILTLTAIHFFVTAVIMEALALIGVFQRNRLPLTESVSMTTFCVGSIASMNYSLRLNSVGFYQLCKLLSIPWLVIIQRYCYNKCVSKKIKFSLIIVIVGVAVATITDIEMNIAGSIIGLVAMVITTQFHIWQGEKQTQFNLNALQINHAQAFPTFILCAILALLLECDGPDDSVNVLKHTWKRNEITLIAVSGLLAASVNLCAYGLIGNTSPLTYHVVGHIKTVVILIGGFFFSNQLYSDSQMFLMHISGMLVTMIGVALYGHFRLNESKLSDQV
jgi:solute carrier family 35 protein E3